MWKPGIWREEDLTARNLSGFFGRRRFVAVSLYPAVSRLPPSQRERLLERILCRFPAINRTYKRTYRARFASLDRLLARQLRHRFPGDGPVRVHDVGASSGITSVEFYRALKQGTSQGIDFLASDLSVDVQLVSAPPRSLEIVLDGHCDQLLQIVSPPFVFNFPRGESPCLYPLNRLVQIWLRLTGARRLKRRFLAGDRRLRVRRIRLLHPECLRLLETDPGFRFIRYDVATPSQRRFHLVRAMNLLNRSYFSEHQLRRAVTNLCESLQEGGLLVIGSNEGGRTPVQGGVYRKSEGGLRRVEVLGAGSQIDAIVRSTQCTTRHPDQQPRRAA